MRLSAALKPSTAEVAVASRLFTHNQLPEKLILLMIVNALAGKPLPVYRGRGLGEANNVGGWNEKPNLDIVHTVCARAPMASPL